MKSISLVFLFLATYVPAFSNQSLTRYSSSIRTPNTIIEGEINSTSIRRITLRLYTQYFKEIANQQQHVYISTVKNKHYKFSLDLSNQWYYFQLDSLQLNENDISNKYFLIQRGDSVVEHQDSNKIYFLGTGSDKINCQLEINSMDKIRSRGAKLIDNSYIQYIFSEEDSLYTVHLNLINHYKNFLEPFALKLISLDCYASMQLRVLNQLETLSLNPNQICVVQKCFYGRYSKVNLPPVDDNLATKSIIYGYFIYELEKSNLLFGSSDWSEGPPFPTVGQMYNRIDNNYKSLLREKVLTILLVRQDKSTIDSTIYYTNKARASFNEKIYSTILDSVASTTFPGTPAFNFHLQDTMGKFFNLSDFRNKVVLIDCWFRGCSPCRSLTAQLFPIIEMFKNNPHFVSISLCIETQKETWLKGIYGGEYTHPSSTNLITNYLGTSDPFMQYYNFDGAPEILIIDKYGKIGALNPPRPDNKQNKMAYIDLINKLLKQ